MWYVGPTHLRCNQKNIYVVLGLCIVALVIYTFARERTNSFEEYQSCLLKRVAETGTVKFLSAIDEIVDQCTSQTRLDIRQHPQLDIDYIKLNTKDQTNCAVLSYGDWRVVSSSTMSILGVSGCEYHHMDIESNNNRNEGSSRMIAKDHQLPRRTGEESGYVARKGKPVSDQVKKAMRIEQNELEKVMEREERKRSNGKTNEDNEEEEMDGSKHGPNEMEGEENSARRSKSDGRAEEQFKDRKEDNRYELDNNHGKVDGDNAREEGPLSSKRSGSELRKLFHKASKQQLIHHLLINVPNGLDFLAQLLENHGMWIFCQVNIMLSQKSEKDMWRFTSLLRKMLEDTTLLPLTAHSFKKKGVTQLFLVDTSPQCVDLFSFIEPVVVE